MPPGNLNLAHWAVVIVAALVIATVGMVVVGEMQPDAICKDRFGEEWNATGTFENTSENYDNGTTILTVCEAPNGTERPIVVQGPV